MCLAVPARLVERSDNDDAVVDLQGNRLKVSLSLTPEARVGDWVLVHAGFAIARLEEAEALQTWDYLRQVLEEPPASGGEAAGGVVPAGGSSAAAPPGAGPPSTSSEPPL